MSETTMTPRQAALTVDNLLDTSDADELAPFQKTALRALVDHARATSPPTPPHVLTGQAHVEALVRDIEQLNERWPGHVRTLLGADLCDRLLAQLAVGAS